MCIAKNFFRYYVRILSSVEIPSILLNGFALSFCENVVSRHSFRSSSNCRKKTFVDSKNMKMFSISFTFVQIEWIWWQICICFSFYLSKSLKQIFSYNFDLNAWYAFVFCCHFMREHELKKQSKKGKSGLKTSECKEEEKRNNFRSEWIAGIVFVRWCFVPLLLLLLFFFSVFIVILLSIHDKNNIF